MIKAFLLVLMGSVSMAFFFAAHDFDGSITRSLSDNPGIWLYIAVDMVIFITFPVGIALLAAGLIGAVDAQIEKEYKK